MANGRNAPVVVVTYPPAQTSASEAAAMAERCPYGGGPAEGMFGIGTERHELPFQRATCGCMKPLLLKEKPSAQMSVADSARSWSMMMGALTNCQLVPLKCQEPLR